MKTVLIILGIIITLLFLLLILPLTIELSFKDKFLLKVKYFGITVYDNQKNIGDKSKKSSKENSKTKSENNDNKPKDNFLKKTYDQKGLLGTVKYLSDLLSMLFKKIGWLIKRIKFRKFKLNLAVATPDAASTAIQYGAICSALYPVLSILTANLNFKAKEINISADFNKTAPEFQIELIAKASIIVWIIAAIATFLQYSKLQDKESEKNERK